MIMGDTFTRGCTFCNVRTGVPGSLDADGPDYVAERLHSASAMSSSPRSTAMISRTGRVAFRANDPRDPRALSDQAIEFSRPGSSQGRARCRGASPTSSTTIWKRCHRTLSASARYALFHSIQRVRESIRPSSPRSASSCAFGKQRHEVLQVMDDLRSADVSFLTVGQYLQPTRKHHAVMRYIPPDEFTGPREGSLHQGLPDGVGEPADALVASRGEDFAKLKAARRCCSSPALRTHASFFQQAPGAAPGGSECRPRRRRRALACRCARP